MIISKDLHSYSVFYNATMYFSRQLLHTEIQNHTYFYIKYINYFKMRSEQLYLLLSNRLELSFAIKFSITHKKFQSFITSKKIKKSLCMQNCLCMKYITWRSINSLQKLQELRLITQN